MDRNYFFGMSGGWVGGWVTGLNGNISNLASNGLSLAIKVTHLLEYTSK